MLPYESSIPEQTSREFIISAELYVPPTVAFGLRRPTTPRRKADRKEFGKSVENAPKRIKEKSSWMSLTRSHPGSEWRQATCKISDENDHCLLNIYVDETILYQTIHMHMLNHTDIRCADPSLFLRKNCIGISSAGGQRWSSGPGSEQIYLHLGDADACNTWLVLLRSYTKPEIYGQPYDGGLYRMWRQVELTVMQGRNLGNQRPFVNASSSSLTLGEDSRLESDPVDLEVFCEIHINDSICGRTTVMKGIGSPDWHENFVFTDLPPFEALEVLLWKEKRLLKPTLLGSIRIALTNFRRGEDVEGWFPVIQSGGVLTGIQVGEIRMKLKVDEEIVLPHSSYSGMLSVLQSRNLLEWMNDFERKLQLRTLSEQLMFIAIAKGILVKHVTEYADCEVDGTPSSHNTLFRGNTMFTKTMELAMVFYGRGFLEASIGGIIRQICLEKVSIEVDPNRSSKSLKDVERGVEQLVEWCQITWDSIYAHRDNCPHEMRTLFEHVRKLVESRYKKKDGQDTQNRALPWQSVSAFCFLRFVVPAILHPHLFGLTPGLPSASVQRSLTLIAKVIQSLANLNVTVQKEGYMRGVKTFLEQNLPAMVDYILVVSTPVHDAFIPHAGPPAFSHQRLNIVNSLHQRGSNMPILEREAIPLLPHVLDIPRHLACISSSLIRSARLVVPSVNSAEMDNLSELCSRCFEVEEIALQRVRQLATVESHPVAVRWDETSLPPLTPTSPPKSSRPSTAPSSSRKPSLPLPHSPKHLPYSSFPPHPLLGDASTPRRGSVPEISSRKPATSLEDRASRTLGRPRFLRPKSISTDSISTLVPNSAEPDAHPMPESSAGVTSDEPGKKSKSILNGLLIRR